MTRREVLLVIVVHFLHWCSTVLGDTVPGSTNHAPATMKTKKHYKTAFCLTHIETNEIYLHCGEYSLVNVLGAYHGIQEIAMDDNPVCSYLESDQCLRPIPHMGSLRDTCMGQTVCRFPVGIIFLDKCGQDSNFVQVEYECIPGNSADFGNVVDICGDVLEGRSITRPEGYLQSLDYPQSYPPDEKCTCSLATQHEDAQVVFRTLDVDTFSPLYYQRGDDWLEYTTSREQWGSGKLIDKEAHGLDIKTGSNSVFLNFRSDAINEARGFWMNYQGVRADGTPSDVSLSCSRYLPEDHRSSIVCFNHKQPKDEVYLNCHYLGVINILYAEYGYHTDFSNGASKCKPIHQRACTRDAMGHNKMLGSCMGQRECRIVIARETIPSCSQDSNYFQVEYQCIPDNNEPSNIVDICGDKQEGSPVYNDVGYIESLNYPQMYSPDTQCQCKLEVIGAETEIILTLLDMNIEGKCQGGDYLEYNRVKEDIGNGLKVCDQTPGEPIHSKAKTVYLNMNTDGDDESRGFWLKYYGRKPDGSKTKVKVTCKGSRSLIVDAPVQQKLHPDSPDSGKTTHNSVDPEDQDVSVIQIVKDKSSFEKLEDNNVIFGLMVGLGVVAVLIFGVLIGMVAYKYKRKNVSRKGSNDNNVISVTAQASQPSSRLESGYGSTYSNSYNTLQNESSRASSVNSTARSLNTQGSRGSSSVAQTGIQNPGYDNYIPDPDYDEIDNVRRVNTKTVTVQGQYFASYKNPTFDDIDEGLGRSDCFYKI